MPPSSPQPFTGFVPPYEIVQNLRSAGFEPMAPPLREGTIYVLRATDYRGILMRVVVDARTGAIRDVNRIVSANGLPLGMGPEPYGPPPYPSSPYRAPAYQEPATADDEDPGYSPPPPPPPPVVRSVSPTGLLPPLPRPRPAGLAARKGRESAQPAVAPNAQPKPDVGTDIVTTPPANEESSKKNPETAPIND